MDERFFLYNEEVDLCLRVKQSGWKIKIIPGAKLWHKGVNRNYQPSPYVTYYMVRNHLFLLQKHKAPLKVKIEAWLRNPHGRQLYAAPKMEAQARPPGCRRSGND